MKSNLELLDWEIRKQFDSELYFGNNETDQTVTVYFSAKYKSWSETERIAGLQDASYACDDYTLNVNGLHFPEGMFPITKEDIDLFWKEALDLLNRKPDEFIVEDEPPCE